MKDKDKKKKGGFEGNKPKDKMPCGQGGKMSNSPNERATFGKTSMSPKSA